MLWSWFWRLPFAHAIKLVSMVVAPAVAFCITSRERTDRVKQIDNQQHTLMRDYIIKPLYYFQTHDNAVDEYWYGAYNRNSALAYFREATPEKYDASKFFRYACRVMWLWRNSGYGFLYNWFSKPSEPAISVTVTGDSKVGEWREYTLRPSSFQLKKHIPTRWSWYWNINIGWRQHAGFPKLTYADRFIGTGD